MSVFYGRALTAGGGGTSTTKRLEFTYTGQYNERLDGVVELLTSGTLNLLKEAVVDIFAVGGGGGGAAGVNSGGYLVAGGAGGGGYTTTALGMKLAARDYEITIGAGGANQPSSTKNGHDGENSMFDSLVIANGGKGGASRTNGSTGGAGGSGGAAGYDRNTTEIPASGGSNGSSGGSTSNKAGGSGQGTTTREFGEALGKLYSGGGGGGNSKSGGVGGAGGLGGGGNGGYGSGAALTNGSPGKDNTGGGGGAGGGNPSSGYGIGGAGGSGIVCIRLHKEKEGLDFSYTGDYTEREDGVVELRSSGTFVPKRDYVIDTFHVGGGAGGSAVTAAAGGPGGGSGYTKTQRNVSIKKGQQYIITVGLGGSGKPAGGTGQGDSGGVSSGFFDASGSIISANGGSGSNGGSGGGAGGQATFRGAAGGTNGSDGGAGRYGPGGTGQGTNTYEFGEESTDPLKLYAGGGSGGSYYDVSGSTSGGARGGGNGDGGDGEANTGGGGGGGKGYYPQSDIYHRGGTGGSGIICIRLTPSA